MEPKPSKGFDISWWTSMLRDASNRLYYAANWDVVAENISPEMMFGYAKTSGGLKVDPAWRRNAKGIVYIKRALGGYQFFYPQLDPILQADLFVDEICIAMEANPDAILLPPWADLEATGGCDAYTIAKNFDRFLKRVTQRLMEPDIYTAAWWWNQYMKPIPSYTQNYQYIIASYRKGSPLMPKGIKEWKGWQYNDNLKIKGLPGSVDEDLLYIPDVGTIVPSIPEPSIIRLRIMTSLRLRVRSKPSTSGAVVGYKLPGTLVNAYDLYESGDGNELWAQVKDPEGWIAIRIGRVIYSREE